MADRAYLLIRMDDALATETIEQAMTEIYTDKDVEFLDRVVGPYEIITQIETSDLETAVSRCRTISGVKEVKLCKVVPMVRHPAHSHGHLIAAQEG